MSKIVDAPPSPSLIGEQAFADWTAHVVHRTEHALTTILSSSWAEPPVMREAMRYATLGGGKRLRAMLCHAAGELVSAGPAALDAAACAIEMVHACSLVHDDLPALDNDELRRGRPTVHVKFGEALAILVGDGLQARAFEVLSDTPLSSAQRIELVRALAVASGPRGVAGGQAIDVLNTGSPLRLDELEYMHRMKTGALIRAAVFMGIHCGAVPPDRSILDAAEDYQRAVGLAMQVVDDILDVTSDADALGKTPGKDAQANKTTYVSIIGIESSHQFLRDLHQQALAALAPLSGRADRLRRLVDRIIYRKY
jgi:farnesyl diphosphate synthase